MDYVDFIHKMAKENRSYVITKKIAKHGSQTIIVIPRVLEDFIKPGMITKLTLEVLEEM